MRLFKLHTDFTLTVITKRTRHPNPSCTKRFCPLKSSQFADVMNEPFFGHPPTSRAFFGPVSNFRLRVQIAPSPRSPRVYFGGGSHGHFLPPSNPFMNSLLCGEAPLKAASVLASMCALYSCVCVYASASYGCFPLWPRPGCGSRRAPECCLCAILISGEVSGSKNVQRYGGNSALLPAP